MSGFGIFPSGHWVFFQFLVWVLLNLEKHPSNSNSTVLKFLDSRCFLDPATATRLLTPSATFQPQLSLFHIFFGLEFFSLQTSCPFSNVQVSLSTFQPFSFVSHFFFHATTNHNRGPFQIQIVERRAEPQWIVIKYHFHTHSSQFSSKSSARDLSLEAALRVVISPSCDTSIQSEAPTEPSGCMVRVLQRRTYAYAHFEPREPINISPLPGWILA